MTGIISHPSHGIKFNIRLRPTVPSRTDVANCTYNICPATNIEHYGPREHTKLESTKCVA